MEKIDLNNVSLSYETKGKGSDILLLHGFPSNMYMWNEIKNELIEKGYRVTIIEQRGYPLSRLENFDLHSFNIEELSKDIEEFIDQLNTEQFESIIEFFNSMPKLRHVVDVTNPKTNIKSEVVLEGLQSFLE